MSAQPADHVPPQEGVGQTAQSVPDERDERIKQLERLLAEERANAAGLRETLDGTRFKAEILEKSYAKQLADTRERTAALEKALADERAKVAELSSELENVNEQLKETRAELDHVCADRNLKRRPAYARSGPMRYDYVEEGGTINELIANPTWARDRDRKEAQGHAEEQAAAPEAPAEDMLAPELVFTKKDSD
jgi:RNase H-fold protein (predicted Holliday junction resolvase)